MVSHKLIATDIPQSSARVCPPTLISTEMDNAIPYFPGITRVCYMPVLLLAHGAQIQKT